MVIFCKTRDKARKLAKGRPVRDLGSFSRMRWAVELKSKAL